MGCQPAHHANRRLDRHDDELAHVQRQLALLAQATGVNLRRLDQLDRLSVRAGFVATWDEMLALGCDPDTGLALTS